MTPPATDSAARWQLAIDFGTTRTVAAARVLGSDRPAEVIRLGGGFECSSSVLVTEAGEIVAGPQVERDALTGEGRVVEQPKRLLADADADGSFFVGDALQRDVDLVAAVLGFVYHAACRQFGETQPDTVVLTHPVAWGPIRCDRLRAAAELAGLRDVRFITEPEAAAVHLLRRDALRSVSNGSKIAVFDFGGGTLDIAILLHEGGEFELFGATGGSDAIGGEKIDDALRNWILSELPPADRTALLEPESTPDPQLWRRAAHQLRREVRLAKEALTDRRVQAVALPSPPLTVDTIELDEEIVFQRAGDMITAAVRCLAAVLADDEVEAADIAAIYLVGGCSLLSLVDRLLGKQFPGTPLLRGGDPKHAVALGAADFRFESEPVPPEPEPDLRNHEPDPGDPTPAKRPVLPRPGSIAWSNGVPIVALSLGDLIWPDRVSTVVQIDELLVAGDQTLGIGQPLLRGRGLDREGQPSGSSVEVLSRWGGNVRAVGAESGGLLDPQTSLVELNPLILPYRRGDLSKRIAGVILGIPRAPSYAADPRAGVIVEIDHVRHRAGWGQTYLLPARAGRHMLSVYFPGQTGPECSATATIKTREASHTAQLYEVPRRREGKAKFRGV